MKLIFFGNTKYSLIGAQIIHDQLGLTHIVTLPDRKDKHGRLTANPLKIFAMEKNIPFSTVNKIDEQIIAQFQSIEPDFLVVEDYGLILPKTLLSVPKIASLNIHHSLLPKYRGPSPAPTALLNGDKITGVTVMKMTEKVDAGDLLAQEEYDVKPNDTTDSLLTILNEHGAKKLVEVIKDYEHFSANAKIQDESQATFTKMMKKQDGFIDLSNPPTPTQLDNMIRAYFPWPTVWTKMEINGKEKIVKFLPAPSLQETTEANNMEISSKILLQVEGKKPMTIKDFINGYPLLKEVLYKILH